VREAERLAQGAGKKKSAGKGAGKDADIRALEHDLANRLGLKVEIHHRGPQGGALTIHYTMLEQLDDILQRLSRGGPANKAGVRPEPAPVAEMKPAAVKPATGKISVALRPVPKTAG